MKRWAILGDGNTLFVNGLVYGHPDHGDGRQITTPAITRRFLDDDGVPVYVAKNRVMYRLADPHPDYEEDFPGSMQRIIDEITAGLPLVPGREAPKEDPVTPKEEPIIEEKPGTPLRPENPHGLAVAILAKAADTPASSNIPLIRSTDKLPDCELFWWRPIEQFEKTDEEVDGEAFESLWNSGEERERRAPDPDYGKEEAKRIFLAGCAAARARK